MCLPVSRGAGGQCVCIPPPWFVCVAADTPRACDILPLLTSSPLGLISYSEGTRYSARKAEQAASWCVAHGKPLPQHLLYPRTKGFVASVRRLRASASHVSAVYDVTVAYAQQHGRRFMAPPSIWQTLVSRCGLSPEEGYRFHVHVRRFAMSELPDGDEALAAWLEQRWVEKGEWLEAKRLERATF